MTEEVIDNSLDIDILAHSIQNTPNYTPNLINLFNLLCGTNYDPYSLKCIPPDIKILRNKEYVQHTDCANSIRFQELGGIQLLLNLLRNNNETENDLRCIVLAIIMGLTRTMHKEGNKKIIYDCGGLDTIIDMIYSNDPCLIFWGCGALRNIARNDLCKEKIGQSGCITRLLSLIEGNESFIISSALSCLVNLSINKNNKKLIASGIPILIELLKCHDEIIAYDSLWIVSNLASLDENRIKFVSYNGIPPLFNLLQSNNNGIIERTLNAIQNLTCNDEIESLIVKNGGIDILLNLIEGNNSGVVFAACGALNNLTWKEENKSVFVTRGGIPIIVNLLIGSDAETVSYATSILWNISYKNNSNIKEIINCNGIVHLIQYLDCDHRDIMCNVLGTIQNVSCDKSAKIDIIQKGALSKLIHILGYKDSHYAIKVENILINIFNLDEALKLAVENGHIIPLIKLLREQPFNNNARNVLIKIRNNDYKVYFNVPTEFEQGNFDALVNNPLFSDVQFIVENKVIYAHKSILFSRTDYWNKLFVSGMSDSNSSIIVVKENCTYDSYFELIRFIYNHTHCNINEQNVYQILLISDYYGIDKLVGLCEKFIYERVSKENIVNVLLMTHKFNSVNLRKAIQKLIVYEFEPEDVTDEIIEILLQK